MNVLSLFDGISAGRIALQRSGINVHNYYASEIDKFAISVSKKNYPDIIHLGDVNNWKSWKLPKIDLLIGGSPCQGFSNAGDGLNFEDPRSKLFFVYADILEAIKPKFFLLENVKMKDEWAKIISKRLGVRFIEIDSALVSAQSRKRYYWTNIVGVRMPKDKCILLKDVVESGDAIREKSYCIDANYSKGGKIVEGSVQHQSNRRQMVREHRSIEIGKADLNGNDICKRVYSVEGKSPSVKAQSGGNLEPKITEDNVTWRKLTPLECERLQTFPDGYTDILSNSQRYKCLGNSWTVDVIAHIFDSLPNTYRKGAE